VLKCGKVSEPRAPMMKNYFMVEIRGHGYLNVSKKDLIELEILSRIGVGSFEDGDSVYLEEDDDVPIFMTAARLAGWQVDFIWGEAVTPRAANPN
jgi:hypothetical protein